MDPVSAAIMITSAATSAKQAREQNKSVNRSMSVAQRNAGLEQQQVNLNADLQGQQLSDAAGLELRKRADQAAAIQGRLRVINADRGGGTGGTALALSRQASLDEAQGSAIIGQNFTNASMRIESERAAGVMSSQSALDASMARLQAGLQSPFLAGLTGGLQGLQTGLSISSQLSQASQS